MHYMQHARPNGGAAVAYIKPHTR